MTSLSKHFIKEGENVTVIKNANSLYPDNSCKSIVPDNLTIYEVNCSNNELALKEAYITTLNDILVKSVFDIIIVSGGPFYTLPAVINIHRTHNVDYVIDFRDLWLFNNTKETTSLRILLGKMRIFLINLKHFGTEYLAIKNALAIITVSSGDKQIMQKQYKKYKDKIHVVYNGYDDIQLKDLPESVPTYKSFVIGHFGKLSNYSKRYGIELFRAIMNLRNKGIDIKLLHISQYEDRDSKIMKDLDFDSAGYINTGLKSYVDGISMLKNVDMLSLIHVHPTGFGTKIFDYLYLNKPIIAVSPPNIFLSKFISQYQNAFVCQSSEQIIEAIETVIRDKKKILDRSNNYLEYSRTKQNEVFYQLLKDIVISK